MEEPSSAPSLTPTPWQKPSPSQKLIWMLSMTKFKQKKRTLAQKALKMMQMTISPCPEMKKTRVDSTSKRMKMRREDLKLNKPRIPRMTKKKKKKPKPKSPFQQLSLANLNKPLKLKQSKKWIGPTGITLTEELSTR